MVIGGKCKSHGASPFSVQGGVDHGLDGVHPVLGLVKHHGLLALEHLVGDLHLGDAELLGNVCADGGAGVMEGGQAVHEDGAGGGHAAMTSR